MSGYLTTELTSFYKQEEIIMGEQLSFLPNEKNTTDCSGNPIGSDFEKTKPSISERLIKEIETMSFPFIGCDFESVYPELAQIIPKESIMFDCFEIDVVTMGEIVCAGICHQINWDYLRHAIWEKVKNDAQWMNADHLMRVTANEVNCLLKGYEKKDRIRGSERASMIKEIAAWIKSFKSPHSVFLDENMRVLPSDNIHENISQCPVFSNDPEEKKYNLLLQKLSMYTWYKDLANYCKPAVDYHLIRSYLRRGLLFPTTEYAKEYLENSESVRKESTVGALRHLCSEVMVDLCGYTKLDICTINQIEWHIGRSICSEDIPDCDLERPDSQWLKTSYNKCPFSSTCVCKLYSNRFANEPKYKGNSY